MATRVRFNVNTAILGRSWRAGIDYDIEDRDIDGLSNEIRSGLVTVIAPSAPGTVPTPTSTIPTTPTVPTVGTFDSADTDTSSGDTPELDPDDAELDTAPATPASAPKKS